MSRYLFDWYVHSVEVDRSTQVLEIEVAELESFHTARGRTDLEQIPVNPADPSLGTISVVPSRIGPRLYAKLSDLPDRGSWVPAQAFAVKARAFDERLLATAESLGREGLLLPPSDPEMKRLVDALMGKEPPPEGTSFIDGFVQRIRDGRLDTTPGTQAAVSDHQLHALAPLLVPEWTPEAERLVVGPEYRGGLESQFRGLSVQERETRLRKVEGLPAQGHMPRPLRVEPRLSIEPLAEHYRRCAETYRFLQRACEESLGADALSSVRRALPEGRKDDSLLDELVWMEQLFRGAHAIVREELGVESIPDAALPATFLTRQWLQTWKQDSDIQADIRRVMPLEFDKSRGLTRAMAVMGFLSAPLEARFRQVPQIRVFERGSDPLADVEPTILPAQFNTLCPVADEVYVRTVPDPATFRELCDTHCSREAILQALQV
ncbi:hypothetical protein SAMN05443572_102847 [Myxococcus fulvus]|uniref:Uncharacterized protein n=1 Tax=Myxococcus fulvus TaxID=33 RepID=A0A511SVV9_MYXFU|nr:hypothetical protein [Myxococcus fulvus]GEN06036.1 hypothetical protein MFU01_10730 [Myxococcus fulvus]SET60224.1 hypothetical protein SAMN05443572_102847 [Myxococcus fulvus]